MTNWNRRFLQVSDLEKEKKLSGVFLLHNENFLVNDFERFPAGNYTNEKILLQGKKGED